MRRVYSSASLAAAHHARNLLEAAGIGAFVKNEMLASALGELPFADCQPEVWVADPAQAESAERILREGPLRLAEDAAVWQCTCGEICEGQFTQCWRCGALRSA
ncbi:MAG: DUF2007 domain-containing protein [Betaproteobacteria bacterium]|nr:DUF2007 domain-containing protein [Betaproteobacteria bacterium]